MSYNQIARRIVDLWHKLLEWMNKQRAPSKYSNKENTDCSPKDRKCGKNQDDPIADRISGVIEAIKNEANTNRHEQRNEAKISRRIEVLTLVLVALTAAFVFWQDLIFHQTMVEANTNAIAQLKITQGQLEQMQADQRPWIGVTNIFGLNLPKAGEIARIPLTYDNVGGRPAFNVKAIFSVFIVGPSRTEPNNFDVPCGICGEGEVVFPHMPGGRTIESRAITQQEVDGLDARDGTAIYLVGRIDYFDYNGTAHKTGICEIFTRVQLLNPDKPLGFRACNKPSSNSAD